MFARLWQGRRIPLAWLLLTRQPMRLLVALAAPILGAVADRGSARKQFLALFAYLGVLATAALYFVGQGEWAFAVVASRGPLSSWSEIV